MMEFGSHPALDATYGVLSKTFLGSAQLFSKISARTENFPFADMPCGVRYAVHAEVTCTRARSAYRLGLHA